MDNIRKESVVLLAERDGKVLAVSRKHDHNDFGLVGGKVEGNESHEEALRRETHEETGLHLDNITHVLTKPKDGWSVSVYRANVSGDIKTDEPHIVSWVPWKTVLNGSFGEYNKELYKHLQKNASSNEKPTAIIIKGNPKFIDEPEIKPMADKYYNEIKKYLDEKGYRTSFNNGEPYTQPEKADVWIGHSRGCDRLRFANRGTTLIGLGTNQPIKGCSTYIHPNDSSGRSEYHYCFNKETKSIIDKALSSKSAAMPNLLPFADDVVNLFNRAKKNKTNINKPYKPEEEDEEGLKPLNKQSSETRQKDLDLWKQWKDNPTPANLSPLMKQIEPIVISETNRWNPSTVDKNRLEMQGKILAYEALGTYDPTKSQLNTHITNNLRHMSRYVINSQNIIRQPEEKIYNHRKFLSAKQELEDKLGYEPTNTEIYKSMGDTVHMGKIGDYKPMIENFYSKAAENGKSPVMDELSTDATAMAMLYDNLSDQHKYIFKNTYGYQGARILTNQQIAKNLGSSPANISKHKRKIEEKYKKYISAMNSLSK
jgi:ADP-ribose pyrophosphatase YjhB (NUDIX family)/DNA-directed RNA polymerase specialized sigma subunit